MNKDEADKTRREVLRWRILRTIDIGRPYPVAEDIVFQTVAGMDMPISNYELRREIDYLRIRELIVVKGMGTPQWSLELTRHGVDLAEYNIDCEPGIARPVKYW